MNYYKSIDKIDLTKSWSGYLPKDERDLTNSIKKELKSLKLPPIETTRYRKLTDRKEEEYINLINTKKNYLGKISKNEDDQKNEINDLSKYLQIRQSHLEEIFEKFVERSSPNLTQFYTVSTTEENSNSYHKDILDKRKILDSYNYEIAKLIESFKTTIYEDLTKIQNNFLGKINEIFVITREIHEKILKSVQKRLCLEVTNLLKMEDENAYRETTRRKISSISRVDCKEILDYSLLFFDNVIFFDLFEENFQKKKKFLIDLNFWLRSNSKPIQGDYITYSRIFDKSLGKIENSGLKISEKFMIKNQSVLDTRDANYDPSKPYNQIRDKNIEISLKNSLKEIDQLPPDNVPIFKLGDKSKKAQLYWKVNRLIEEKKLFTGHSPTDVINQVVFLENGRYVLTSSFDNSIRLTNVVTGDPRFTIPKVHYTGHPVCLLHSITGLILSGGDNGEISIFEPLLGKRQYSQNCHSGRIWGIAEMPGDSIVTVSEDHYLKFWDFNRKIREIDDALSLKTRIISPQNRPLRCLKRITESHFAFSSHRIWIYDVNKSAIIKMLTGHNGYVTAMEMDKKRNYLISSGEDATIRWWELNSCECLKTVRVAVSYTFDIWDEEFLVSGHRDGKIRFWDLGLKRVITEQGFGVFVDSVRVLDGKVVFGEYNAIVFMKVP